MQHHRAVPGAVFADIACVQPFGQVRVDLERAALPVAADGVGQHEFQLWPVKGAFAGEKLIGMPRRRDGIGQRGLGKVPACFRADAFFGPRRQFDPPRVEPKIGIDRRQEFDEPLRLALDLVRPREDVAVVLGEAAHPHDAVQGAAGFIPRAGPEFGHPQGQVAIGLEADVEDLHVAGAVHRL